MVTKATIDNYRRAYRDKHGKEYGGSDDEIALFYSNASGAPSQADCDQWVLEDMEMADSRR